MKPIDALLLLTLVARRARPYAPPPPLGRATSASALSALRRPSFAFGDGDGDGTRRRSRSAAGTTAVAAALAVDVGREDLEALTVPLLKDRLRERGQKVSGRKAELIERLLSSSDDAADAEEGRRAARTVQAGGGGTAGGSSKSAGGSGGSGGARRGARDDDDDLLDAAFDSMFGALTTVLDPMPNSKPEPEPELSRVRTGAVASSSVASAKKTTTPTAGFSGMDLPQPILRRLAEMGMAEPTPIQREAIPVAMGGADVMGLAQTGTGKTLAFGVPLASRMLLRPGGNRGLRGAGEEWGGAPLLRAAPPPPPKGARALVLAPTRELANQIAEQLRSLTEGSAISTLVVVGGKHLPTQANKLVRGTHILVATPGRLMDLLDRRALTLQEVEFLVLDEADMMLDMGFAPSLKKIVGQIPTDRQTMLFSATMNAAMAAAAKTYLNKPKRIEVARAGRAADKVSQEVHYVSKPDKMSKLMSLLNKHGDPSERTLIFGRTKRSVERLSKRLIHAGVRAGSIHGDKSQPQRDRAIREFKLGAVDVLVATDVAARGLDIPDVRRVYNFDLPNQPENYIHRIGRTARAGKDGAAIALCSVEEMDDLAAIQTLVGMEIPVASGKPWSRFASKRAKDNQNKDKRVSQEHLAERKRSQKKGSFTSYRR